MDGEKKVEQNKPKNRLLGLTTMTCGIPLAPKRISWQAAQKSIKETQTRPRH